MQRQQATAKRRLLRAEDLNRGRFSILTGSSHVSHSASIIVFSHLCSAPAEQNPPMYLERPPFARPKRTPDGCARGKGAPGAMQAKHPYSIANQSPVRQRPGAACEATQTEPLRAWKISRG